MSPNPVMMKAIEDLNYKVTVGDVASKAGLEINLAQQGLLTLAADAGGHLQVTETGEIIYSFPKDFRSILRNKFLKLRLQELWEKIWKVLFYLIRISFGIVLIASIILMVIAIVVIVLALNSSRDSDDRDDRGGGFVFFPTFWFSDLFYIFTPNYDAGYYQRQRQETSEKKMNFLLSVFSFLFGDGNPNAELEARRWRKIGGVIRNHQGAVIAEQIAPYLDNIDSLNKENEDYMIPVLARFNGYPQVSPQGEIIYYFPELQVTTGKSQGKSLSTYLQEKLWKFSEAGSGQLTGAIGLGVVNIVLAVVLGSLLNSEVVLQLGGLVGFVNSIYVILLAYAIAFLGIPLIRYFWIQWQNGKITERNQRRQSRAEYLSIKQAELTPKIDYARQFAAEKIVTEQQIAYRTDQDLLEQEITQGDKIDQEWQRRLESESRKEFPN